MEVRKISANVQISRATALDYGLVQPTDEERRQHEEWRAEWERRKEAATEARPVFIAALDAVSDPVARAVLDLHRSDEHRWCAGCEGSDNCGESPEWPCSTVEVVAGVLGIPIPPDLDLVNLR